MRVDGPLVMNTIDLILEAALDGHGLAYLPLDQVQLHLDEGRLVRALSKFTPDLPGYHLYYPHRRHASSAFTCADMPIYGPAENDETENYVYAIPHHRPPKYG